MVMFSEAGNVQILSGAGSADSSGSLSFLTPNAGALGGSGSLTLASGTSSSGASGGISFTSGASTGGAAGAFTVALGAGDTGNGADLMLSAGGTSALGLKGGSIALVSGFGSQQDSGSVSITTPNAGLLGTSGAISLRTGTSSSGASGSVSFVTGAATGGARRFIYACFGHR